MGERYQGSHPGRTGTMSNLRNRPNLRLPLLLLGIWGIWPAVAPLRGGVASIADYKLNRREGEGFGSRGGRRRCWRCGHTSLFGVLIFFSAAGQHEYEESDDSESYEITSG